MSEMGGPLDFKLLGSFMKDVRAERDAYQATIQRVRELASKWEGSPGHYSVELCDGLQTAADELTAALDGTT